MPRADHLFAGGELRDALEGQARGLSAEIEKAPEDHLLQADEDSWVAALVERYQVIAPRLLSDQWSMDKPTEIKIDVSWDHMRAVFDRSRPAYVNGFRVRVHVPFEGEADVFKVTPSTRNFNPPRAVISRGEVLIDIEYPHDAPADVRAVALDVIGDIERYLEWARGDIATFNEGLEQRARAAIQARRDRVRQAYDRLAETGIPLRQTQGEQPKTYIADVLVRRPSPTIPKGSTDIAIPLEPVLSDVRFEHILGVIRATAEAMERSPKTYAAMGEEDRRQVLVAALNTHYQSTTAEAFNVNGKTDILVRHEGRNLFIGECKIWSGAKNFAATIDQLFSYAAWRDSKLAIVMFVREKGLTEIVDKARETLAAHSQFVSWHGATPVNELRATMKWPGDEARHADLNVFFVHTPE